jgi:hypothetical protein
VPSRPPKSEHAYDDNLFCTWKNHQLRNENHNEIYKPSVDTGWLYTSEVQSNYRIKNVMLRSILQVIKNLKFYISGRKADFVTFYQ